jgi:hypothetical protein
VSDIVHTTLTPQYGIVCQLNIITHRPYITRSSSYTCLSKLVELTKAGATIIRDKSYLSDSDRVVISTVIADLWYILTKSAGSGNLEEEAKNAPFVYVVEEGHNLLSTEMLRGETVFIDFAKTGRSFRIGLVAITQQPSSIEAKITSQFDNWITLRLVRERDVKDLVSATSAFQGYEGEIRSLAKGSSLAMFDETSRVRSVQVFERTDERARTLLSKEQEPLIPQLRSELARHDHNGHPIMSEQMVPDSANRTRTNSRTTILVV